MTSVAFDAAAVRQLEETTFASWPDLAHERLDGWLLRFARGHTKRANSVNMLESRPDGLEARIAEAERRYRQAGLRPVFRLTPLAEPGLDALLAARGYAPVEPSLVKVAPMPPDIAADSSVRLDADPDGGWLDGYAQAAGLDGDGRATLRAMLERIDGIAAYASIAEAGQAQGFAMAVTHAGRVGFFDVLTLPHARRRGIARCIMASLIAWSREEGGARSMWIQVVEANAPARSLYRALGFATQYAYHYRVAP